MKTVLVDRKDNICTLTLNRPEIMNAMNIDMIMELKTAVENVSTDENVRVLVLKGAGGNFSSGADMALLNEDISIPGWHDMLRGVGELVRTLREMPHPVITALTGVAVGGGANLALSGDFVIAADDARFCEIFIHIGAIMDYGGTYFLPRLVGLAKARELAMLGSEVDGKTAASIGLIYKSTPADQLDQEVDLLAGNLAQKPRKTLALIKEGLEKSFDMTLKQTLDWEAAHQAIGRFEADYRAKYPKAVASLRRDEAELLTFFDFPAEHWLHLRTGNVIESPFATVRLRQRVTKGAGSRQKGLLMAFQLLAMAEQRWRRINGAHLIPLVRAGVLFSDGVQAEGRNAA